MSDKDRIIGKIVDHAGFTQSSTREELVTINLEFNAEMYLAAAELLKKLCGFDHRDVVQPGDSVIFNYSFSINYFGEVEEKLDQTLVLLDTLEMAVVSIDSNLLDKTTCLLARVVEKLRQIQTMIAPREA